MSVPGDPERTLCNAALLLRTPLSAIVNAVLEFLCGVSEEKSE